jgi:predicted nuclease with TOPRIM domain
MLKRYLNATSINGTKPLCVTPILFQNKAYKCTKFEETTIKYKKKLIELERTNATMLQQLNKNSDEISCLQEQINRLKMNQIALWNRKPPDSENDMDSIKSMLDDIRCKVTKLHKLYGNSNDK